MYRLIHANYLWTLQSKFGNSIQGMYSNKHFYTKLLNFYQKSSQKRVMRIFRNILAEDDIQELIILQRGQINVINQRTNLPRMYERLV